MSWSLEFMPWPLERLVRQYLGFNESVIQEYNNLIEYDVNGCLRNKDSQLVAQWRGALDNCIPRIWPYIYKFPFVCNNNNPCRISEPKCLYKDIVKSEPICFYKNIVKTSERVGRVRIS